MTDPVKHCGRCPCKDTVTVVSDGNPNLNMTYTKESQPLIIEIVTDDNMLMPTKAHETDACFDLYSNEDVTIHIGEQVIIRTGISIALPEGHAGFIWSRSGLAAKHGLDVRAGVIDESYRGPLNVVIKNDSGDDYAQGEIYHVKKYDRIAQMQIVPVPRVEFKQVVELSSTDRDVGGFGSSGR